MVKVKAKFDYYIQLIEGYNFIIIEDINNGSMSVTNDIENIVKSIEEKENIKATDFFIVYRDSDDTWDGWNAAQEKFISLNCKTTIDAIKTYISYSEKLVV